MTKCNTIFSRLLYNIWSSQIVARSWRTIHEEIYGLKSLSVESTSSNKNLMIHQTDGELNAPAINSRGKWRIKSLICVLEETIAPAYCGNQSKSISRLAGWVAPDCFIFTSDSSIHLKKYIYSGLYSYFHHSFTIYHLYCNAQEVQTCGKYRNRILQMIALNHISYYL